MTVTVTPRIFLARVHPWDGDGDAEHRRPSVHCCQLSCFYYQPFKSIHRSWDLWRLLKGPWPSNLPCQEVQSGIVGLGTPRDRKTAGTAYWQGGIAWQHDTPGLKVVKQTLFKTRSLKNRWTISQQPIAQSIAKAILEDHPIVEKSV